MDSDDKAFLFGFCFTVACLLLLALSLMTFEYQKQKMFAEQGYTQVMLPGRVGHVWVKEDPEKWRTLSTLGFLDSAGKGVPK